jgi:hypothetical protein
MITKKSSYSPVQRLPMAPAKPWSNKLKISSYDKEGFSSSFREAPRHNGELPDKNSVRLRSTGEGGNG